MTPAPISRRRAIILGGLGAASLAAGATGWIAAGPGVGTSRLEPADAGTELRQPPVLDSRDGRLQVELTAAAGARLGGVDTQALGFNDTSPGPTLRVRPGDELAVQAVLVGVAVQLDAVLAVAVQDGVDAVLKLGRGGGSDADVEAAVDPGHGVGAAVGDLVGGGACLFPGAAQGGRDLDGAAGDVLLFLVDDLVDPGLHRCGGLAAGEQPDVGGPLDGKRAGSRRRPSTAGGSGGW